MKNDLKMTIEVDTSQLDEAIRKMSVMLALQDRIVERGVGFAVVAGVVGVAGSPRRLSRRSLLGLNWR
jgi:hypothetical protein